LIPYYNNAKASWHCGARRRKRSMEDVGDSISSINSSKNIDDPALSLREKLADEAILIVITMEKDV
jgi:hypothetical protein